ncbi:MAG: hypothetical protein Pars92KO_19080 [Parasphingorhabdus sp.]
MAVFFRKITLRSRLDPETCIRRLRKRNSKAELLPFADITNSILYKRFVVSTINPFDWSNKSSEPKFIGSIRAEASGSSIQGYYIPGFFALFTPVFLSLFMLAVMIWLGSAWFAPLDNGINTVQHYLTIAIITIGVLAIVMGIGWTFLSDRWENDRLIEKLSKILDAEIIEQNAARGEK